MIRAILERVERRELIIDQAILEIDAYYQGAAYEPEDRPIAIEPPDRVGMLTTYGTAQVKQSRSKEKLPLSDDQKAEAMKSKKKRSKGTTTKPTTKG